MLFLIIFLGVLFLVMSFVLTEKNASSLLSGYNRMSKEEKAEFDLKNYLSVFRKFHIFLGLSTLIIGLWLHFWVSKNAGLTFAAIYPIFAYIFFIAWSKKYEPKRRHRTNNIGVIILILTAIGVSFIFFKSFQETKIHIEDTAVRFVGMYGETIDFQDIGDVKLLQKLPRITAKLHGTAMDGIYKGKFKTADEGIVKLLINAENKPYIQIIKKNDKSIFFASKNDDNGRIYKQLKEKWINR